jgi:hypothetical protein
MLFSTTTTSIGQCTPDYILEKYNTLISVRVTKKIKKSIGFRIFLDEYNHHWCMTYSNSEFRLQKNQPKSFINILYFLYKTTCEKYVWDMSPIFVVENFKKYIGDPSLIKDDVILSQLVHVTIRREFEEKYLIKNHNERQIKLLTIL